MTCSCSGACWGWAFTSLSLLPLPCPPRPSFPEPRLLLCWGFSRVMTSQIREARVEAGCQLMRAGAQCVRPSFHYIS